VVLIGITGLVGLVLVVVSARGAIKTWRGDK